MAVVLTWQKRDQSPSSDEQPRSDQYHDTSLDKYLVLHIFSIFGTKGRGTRSDKCQAGCDDQMDDNHKKPLDLIAELWSAAVTTTPR